MNPALRRRRSSQRGYALILAMVALVSLTILGVTAIGVAQMDMKITNNLRHHRQVAYGAYTGLDHARDLFSDNLVDPSTAIETAADEPGDCMAGWISSTSTFALDAPLVLASNSYNLATYTVDFCVATCGDPLAGNSLGERVVGYTVDIVSTGSSPLQASGTGGSNASQSQGSLVYGQLEQAFCE